MIAADTIPPTERACIMPPAPVEPATSPTERRLTLLPPPSSAAVERAAISAAEALHLYGVTLGADDERRPPSLDADIAAVELRRGEARAACQILGSTLDDAGDPRGATRAYAIAGEIRLDDVGLHDWLDGFESWCREVAAAAHDEARATEPGEVAGG